MFHATSVNCYFFRLSSSAFITRVPISGSFQLLASVTISFCWMGFADPEFPFFKQSASAKLSYLEF